VFNRVGNPAVIVRGKSSEDIAAALRFARERGLVISVRSGGHLLTGQATNDGGLVLDMTRFNTVTLLDPKRRLVRIGPGARWGEVARALAEHDLAISSGDTNQVGVGGLTLGGGIGWLVRAHGLTIDSLRAAEVVTADGRILRVSAEEYPNLFWAIRGGGGNFGVVTSFDFEAQPCRAIVGGLVSYNTTEAHSVLANWEPFLRLGAVRSQDVQKKPYAAMLEDAPPFPPSSKLAGHDGFVKTLNADLLEALAAHYGQAGAPIAQIRRLGGAMARVSPEATAFAHREDEALVVVPAFVPADAPDKQVQQIREAAWRPLAPWTSGAYGNFLSEASEASVAAAYPGETYTRLARIKAIYDPENLFNQNLNIKPMAQG
jgi:FAD/FMN-containing dehydrogenase